MVTAACGADADGISGWVPFAGRSLQCSEAALHIGSARPHAREGGAATREVTGEGKGFSLRRLEPASKQDLLCEPLPVCNIPNVTQWEKAPAPSQASPPPGPFTTRQLMPEGVAERLQKFKSEVAVCFRMAMNGRWKQARDRRPVPIELSESQALMPAARGWTWLWHSEDELWHAATPSSYPDDLPGADLEVERIVQDARKGKFDDMQIISQIAHGYEGPELERTVIIGAPHVGALREVASFVKSAN